MNERIPQQQPSGDAVTRYASGLSRPQEAGGGPGRPARGDSLVDLLDRVLDKGVVIAGDISISLLDIELLTIKIRLLIASADKAKEMGIDWWAHDPQLSASARTRERKLEAERENKELRGRIDDLESRLTALLEDRTERGQGHPARPAAALPAGGRRPRGD